VIDLAIRMHVDQPEEVGRGRSYLFGLDFSVLNRRQRELEELIRALDAFRCDI